MFLCFFSLYLLEIKKIRDCLMARVPLLLFLSHFDVISHLLLSGNMASWNLFAKWCIQEVAKCERSVRVAQGDSHMLL